MNTSYDYLMANLEDTDDDEILGTLDEMESKYDEELEKHLGELQELEKEHEKISDPGSLGDIAKKVIWEQFQMQIGGEESAREADRFIESNNGQTLDLSKDAHIQTEENFTQGNLATHNTYIDYQERYDQYQNNFARDEYGNVITHTTRTGREEATLVNGARKPYDNGRPTGSIERGTDMDHTVSAGEIIRDAKANAHLSEEERIRFANSDANLNEMLAVLNRSKGDLPMEEWLNTPNANGQCPREIFDISPDMEAQLIAKDREARKAYRQVKATGKRKSTISGKESRKEEAERMGKSALYSVAISLLSNLLKEIGEKLTNWFRSSDKSLSSFIDSMKNSIKDFFSKLKSNIKESLKCGFETIISAIFGPIVRLVKRTWALLKQGYRSVKEAINYLRDPVNKNKSFTVKMLQVSKIIIAGLTAGGTLILGEVFESALITVFVGPLNFLAGLIGGFFAALVSGIVGSLVLRLIDKLIAKSLKKENREKKHQKLNEILTLQEEVIDFQKVDYNYRKASASHKINERHKVAAECMRESEMRMQESQCNINDMFSVLNENNANLDCINDSISNIQHDISYNNSEIVQNNEQIIKSQQDSKEELDNVWDLLNNI